jgi:DNA-binding transcriptional ArsR family regulator
VSPRVVEAAPIFAALGDETRLNIVTRLCADGPLSIVRLTDGSNVTRQAVTKHLRTLSSVGLVKCERAGREQIWALQTARLAEVHRYIDLISQQWDDALGRLKALVEK